MGSDYSWCRVRTGRAPADVLQALVGGLATPPVSRGFVAWRDGPWVQVGDEAASTERQGAYGEGAPGDVAPLLSRLGPTVRMDMSDDAVMRLELWTGGARVASYLTMHFGWRLLDDAARVEHGGNAAAWAELVPPGGVERLAELFVHERSGQGAYAGWRGRPVGQVLAGCAELLGWDAALIEVGWSHDADGLFIPWDGFLEPDVLARFEHAVGELAAR